MNKLLMNLIKKIEYLVNESSYKKSLPDQQYHNDIYIVEYPKSGITWFSNILSNIYLINSGINIRATAFNINMLIPGVNSFKQIHKPYWNTPNSRLIKSHSEFNPYYRNVIYLIRNPLSVMSSHYNYSMGLGRYSGTIKDFIQSDQYNINKWTRHVKSWVENVNPERNRLLLLKYENLFEDTFNIIRGVCDNLGLIVSDSIINDAIDLSSLEEMKKSEKKFKEFSIKNNLEFVNQGGVHSSGMDEEVISLIISNTDPYFERFWPEIYRKYK